MAGALFLFIGKVGRRKETVGGCLRGSAVKNLCPYTSYPTEQFEPAVNKAIFAHSPLDHPPSTHTTQIVKTFSYNYGSTNVYCENFFTIQKFHFRCQL